MKVLVIFALSLVAITFQQDWPSVAQLKSLIADIGVSVIFGIAGADTNNTSLGNFFFPDVYKVHYSCHVVVVFINH